MGRKAGTEVGVNRLFSGSYCHRVGVNSSFVALIATRSRCQ